MFLQIATLAKITDHTGYQLLPKACLQGRTTLSLQLISISTLKWPTQLNPAKPAWLLWTWAIQTLYTKPGLPNQLNCPLGPWTPTTTQIQYTLSPKWCTKLQMAELNSTPCNELSNTTLITPHQSIKQTNQPPTILLFTQ